VGSFVTSSRLYVVDVQTRKLTAVAQNVYYDVHWTAKPERLYFYKCKTAGACGKPEDHLYSAQIE
jgi:hypothetical protein